MTTTNQEPQWLSEIRKKMEGIIKQVGRSGLSLKESEIANLLAYVDRLREALKLSQEFINNGNELGYILMPDCDDPAYKTPKLIEESLAWKPEGK